MKKLSLSNLHKQEIENSQLSKITGGGVPGCCGCGCNGPSSTCDNGHANFNTGSHSPGTEPAWCSTYLQNAGWGVFAHQHGWQC